MLRFALPMTYTVCRMLKKPGERSPRGYVETERRCLLAYVGWTLSLRQVP